MILRSSFYYLIEFIICTIISFLIIMQNYDNKLTFIFIGACVLLTNTLLYYVMTIRGQKITINKTTIIKFFLIYIIGIIVSGVAIMFGFFVAWEYVFKNF